MIVYFCLRHDHDPRFEVIESLNAQTIPCTIVNVKVQGGTEITHRNFSPARVMAEQECRRQIHTKAIDNGSIFYCVSDWDYEHLIKTNIEDMLLFLELNPEYGAVSITNKAHSGHCDIGFVMYRLEAAKKAQLDKITNITKWCMCTDTTNAIRNAGYKFEYLDNLKRVREL